MRAGVLGLGRAGTFFHCRPLKASPKFELAAVADARPDVARRVAEEFGCRFHRSAEELFGDPDLDLAVVAVPTCEHARTAMLAIERGMPVLVEKPFAASPAEAAEIFAAAESAGVPVYPYHNRRFDPDVRALARILESGVLGQVVKVSISIHSFVRRNDWQTLRAMGGGALANWGAHAIDWCFHLFGTDLALEHACLYQVLNPGDAEDGFFLHLSRRLTTIQIEYLNCAAQALPKWHVVGNYGAAVSSGSTFLIRYCDPARLTPIEADPSAASDGKYGIEEDLGWATREEPWDHWDNCPPFLDALHAHITEGAPAPVRAEEVIAGLRLMEEIRATAEVRRLRQPVA